MVTSVVRGLLCVHCNAILVGYFENEEVVRRVKNYLGLDPRALN